MSTKPCSRALVALAIVLAVPAYSVELSVGFSPGTDGPTAESIVLQAIHDARKSIRVAAYSFTSKPIALALVAVHKRGIDVEIVLDKSQRSARYTSATFTANAGIPTRID